MRKTLGYLVHRATILRANSLSFEELCEFLQPVSDWSTYEFIFVSHRWLHHDRPDNEFQTMADTLRLYASSFTKIKHYWIDFCCLPFECQERKILTMQMPTILAQASKFLIVPLSSSSESLIPTSSLQEYCFRAWCALEYAMMMHRLQDAILVSVTKTGKEVKAWFSLLEYTHERCGLSIMRNSFLVLQDIIARDDYDSFSTFYSTSSAPERSLVWDLLHQVSGTISKTKVDQCTEEHDQYEEEVQETFESTSSFDDVGHILFQYSKRNGIEVKGPAGEKLLCRSATSLHEEQCRQQCVSILGCPVS